MSAVQDGLSRLDTVWRWWRGEVAALLPDRVRRWLDGGVTVIAIDLDGAGAVLRRFEDGRMSEIGRLPHFDAANLRAALAPYLAQSVLSRPSFALRLPDTAALRRTLSLPAAARRDLATLLDIELERQSPLDRAEIHHAYRVVEAGAGRIALDWRLVRKRSVAPALEVCREAGIDLAAIAFAGDDAPPDGGTLPVATGAARLLRARRAMVRGLLLLIAALLLAATAGVYQRNQSAADAFAVRVDRTRLAALGALRLEHAVAATRSRDALLLRERQKLSVTRILAETTRLLPQGSWLTAFSYGNGEVRLRGYSNAASSLIAVFDASPLFAGAEFAAPLVQAQSRDLEQFDLTVKLRGGLR